jgi:hypothetical protein
MAWKPPPYLVYPRKREENKMPEIRASVTVEVHRKLKEEAARDGKHLKVLVAELLVEHIKNGGGGARGKPAKKAG